MPIEIHSGEKLHIPRPPRRGKGNAPTPGVVPGSFQTPKFVHQHDLESMKWVLLWFLLGRIDYKQANDLCHLIYTNLHCPAPERRKLFQSPGNKSYSDAFHPNLTDAFAAEFQELHAAILDSYLRDGDPTQAEYHVLYNDIWSCFRRVIKLAVAAQGIKFLPLPQNPELNRAERRGTLKVNDDADYIERTSEEDEQGAPRTPHPMVLRKRKASEIDHPLA